MFLGVQLTNLRYQPKKKVMEDTLSIHTLSILMYDMFK